MYIPSFRQSDRYYNTAFLEHDQDDVGVENVRAPDYEYTDKPRANNPPPGSDGTLRTNSAVSLKEMQDYSSSGHSEQAKATPLITKKNSKSKTHLIQGVPQTDV